MAIVGKVVDLVFVEMVTKVVDSGAGVVDFVGEDSLDRMEDIGSIENIYHKDFSFLVSKVEVETRVSAMELMNSSYFVGAEYTFGC